jgi:pimeloyl-ACP methyl ester carboxylesterase
MAITMLAYILIVGLSFLLLMPLVQRATASESKNEPGKTSPIVLEKFGNFYISGKIVDSPKSGCPFCGRTKERTIIGKAYVEYFIPHGKMDKPPIVLLPGGALPSTIYLTTPDGREGWASFFLRRGYSVYLMDPPGVGRSGFYPDEVNKVMVAEAPVSEAPAPPPGHPPGRRPTPFMYWPDSQWVFWGQGPEPEIAHPGGQFPSGEDAFYHWLANLIPRGPNGGHNATRDALIALLDKIGPAIVIGHSMNGRKAFDAAIMRPGVFKALVVVEPAGAPTNGLESLAKVPIFQVMGARVVPPPRNPILDKFEKEEAALKKKMEEMGGHFERLLLSDVGICGNSHMMMMEKNSDQIAEVILEWINKNALKY